MMKISFSILKWQNMEQGTFWEGLASFGFCSERRGCSLPRPASVYVGALPKPPENEYKGSKQVDRMRDDDDDDVGFYLYEVGEKDFPMVAL